MYFMLRSSEKKNGLNMHPTSDLQGKEVFQLKRMTSELFYYHVAGSFKAYL